MAQGAEAPPLSGAALWSHRIAIATALAAFAMLTLGGLVTSLKAGLAYLTWPSSDGFFVNPPNWTAEPDTLVEHGHRLLGNLLGILGLIQLVWFWTREPRRLLKGLITAAFVLGGVQAVLGGTRVLERSSTLAFLHGCTGQVFLALVVAMAYLTSREGRAPRPDAPGPRLLRTAALSMALLVLFQIVLGAQRRHLAGTPALQAHLIGAVMVLGAGSAVVMIALFRSAEYPRLVRTAVALGALVLVQLALGFAALAALNSYDGGRHTPTQALLPSLHQVVGALLLTTSVLLALRAHKRCGPVAHDAPVGVPA